MTEPREEQVAYGQVSGRWFARGDEWITPVPSLRDHRFDERRFAAAIHAFQLDPAGTIRRRGIVERVRRG